VDRNRSWRVDSAQVTHNVECAFTNVHSTLSSGVDGGNVPLRAQPKPESRFCARNRNPTARFCARNRNPSARIRVARGLRATLYIRYVKYFAVLRYQIYCICCCRAADLKILRATLRAQTVTVVYSRECKRFRQRTPLCANRVTLTVALG
jgi:hypothetical protein